MLNRLGGASKRFKHITCAYRPLLIKKCLEPPHRGDLYGAGHDSSSQAFCSQPKPIPRRSAAAGSLMRQTAVVDRKAMGEHSQARASIQAASQMKSIQNARHHHSESDSQSHGLPNRLHVMFDKVSVLPFCKKRGIGKSLGHTLARGSNRDFAADRSRSQEHRKSQSHSSTSPTVSY
eukprot:COSAG01_NODE_2240_length_8087_cov_10.836254_5_plen_177_part_00